jgi:hypothetical protein
MWRLGVDPPAVAVRAGLSGGFAGEAPCSDVPVSGDFDWVDEVNLAPAANALKVLTALLIAWSPALDLVLKTLAISGMLHS